MDDDESARTATPTANKLSPVSSPLRIVTGQSDDRRRTLTPDVLDSWKATPVRVPGADAARAVSSALALAEYRRLRANWRDDERADFDAAVSDLSAGWLDRGRYRMFWYAYRWQDRWDGATHAAFWEAAEPFWPNAPGRPTVHDEQRWAFAALVARGLSRRDAAEQLGYDLESLKRSKVATGPTILEEQESVPHGAPPLPRVWVKGRDAEPNPHARRGPRSDLQRFHDRTFGEDGAFAPAHRVARANPSAGGFRATVDRRAN